MRGYTVVEIPTNDDRERKRERGERLTKGRLSFRLLRFRLLASFLC